MRKNIWIMNHYAGSMFFDKGGRHYNFAKYLRRAGYEPVIFCANSKHGQQELFFDNKDLWHEHIAEEIATPFVFVKARTYQGNGKQRVLNMIDFYRNVKKTAWEYVKTHKKPDIIYASSVHPLTLVAGIQLAKHFGVKCICEVRDLWPESIVAMGIAGAKNPAVIVLRCLEKWIYKKADALIFTMEGAYDYIVERGWEKEIPRNKVFHINNGVDLETFQYNREHFHLDDSDLKDETTFKVIYTGSIRLANGVSQLIDCAQYLRNERDIKFLVYGKGEDADKLKQICGEKNLDNLLLKGYVEKKYIPYILSKSDLNLLNYFAAAVAGLYRFGSSQNKMFDYLASGKPVLANTKTNYDIVEKYHCGVCKQLVNGEDYAKEILKIKNLPKEEYAELCQNTQKAAQDYDFKVLTQRLLQVVKGDGNDAIH